VSFRPSPKEKKNKPRKVLKPGGGFRFKRKEKREKRPRRGGKKKMGAGTSFKGKGGKGEAVRRLDIRGERKVVEFPPPKRGGKEKKRAAKRKKKEEGTPRRCWGGKGGKGRPRFLRLEKKKKKGRR